MDINIEDETVIHSLGSEHQSIAWTESSPSHAGEPRNINVAAISIQIVAKAMEMNRIGSSALCSTVEISTDDRE